MTRALSPLWFSGFVLLFAIPAAAQSVPQSYEWSHGTTLNVFGGAARADGDTRPVAGGSIGWEILPTLAIESSGYWFDRGADRDAFAAAVKLRAALPIRGAIVPFAVAGIGLYRASFDPAASTIPDFYRARMVATGTAGSVNVFTDPSFIAGGGLNVFISRHVSVRPDVEATFVTRHSQHYLVTVAAVHLAYHFEKHPLPE